MRELKVIKADGSIEDYLYTKVLGAISNAMAGAGQLDILTAEQLADAVTYFLYQDDKRHKVSSGEILSIIEATLDATGYEQVAAALSNYHYERRLKARPNRGYLRGYAADGRCRDTGRCGTVGERKLLGQGQDSGLPCKQA